MTQILPAECATAAVASNASPRQYRADDGGERGV
jgi:hypothetical protein